EESAALPRQVVFQTGDSTSEYFTRLTHQNGGAYVILCETMSYLQQHRQQSFGVPVHQMWTPGLLGSMGRRLLAQAKHLPKVWCQRAVYQSGRYRGVNISHRLGAKSGDPHFAPR
ncbi:MAG: hypothetical protein MUC85_01355, partial [Anaerolineales bacterium]|nr:hypothetical protein [Anaerolineales bacterium]